MKCPSTTSDIFRSIQPSSSFDNHYRLSCHYLNLILKIDRPVKKAQQTMLNIIMTVGDA